MRKLITLLFILSISYHYTAAQTIHGYIKNQDGTPISAVVVEQKQGETYALSDTEGYFSLELNPKIKKIIICKYVDYFTRTIELSPEMYNDTIQIIMLPGKDVEAEKYSLFNLTHIGGFSINAGYKFFYSNFDNFTELKPLQINQLNKNMHYGYVGFSGYVYNIYANLDFGFSPLLVNYTKELRHMTDSYFVSFDLGYGISLMKNRAVVLTPYFGVNQMLFTEYFAPLSNHIALEEYLKRGYLDLRILQYTGNLGCNFTFNLFQFGKKIKKHGLYITASAAYNFRLNKYPNITTRKTQIHTPSTINIYPLTASISLQYIITTKNKSWRKTN